MLKQGTILWHYGSNTVNASLCEELKKIIQVVFFSAAAKGRLVALGRIYIHLVVVSKVAIKMTFPCYIRVYH